MDDHTSRWRVLCVCYSCAGYISGVADTPASVLRGVLDYGYQLALRWQWVLCMLAGAIGIHIMETMYRLKIFDSYWSLEAILTIEPFRLVAGVSLFWGFRRAPSFLSGWTVFIACIVVSRTIINFYTGEPWNEYVIVGIIVLIYGLFLTMQSWRYPYARLVPCSDVMPHDIQVGARLGVAVGVGLVIVSTLMTVGVGKLLIAQARLFEPGWWMAYLFGAALLIAFEEYIARKGLKVQERELFPRYLPFSINKREGTLIPYQVRLEWRSAYCLFFVVNLFLNAGLFYGYRDAMPTFIFGWAVYTIWDVILRSINNFLLGERFYVVHALGMLLVVLGTWLSFLGRIPSM